MKTTNFFIDFIICGVVSCFAIAITGNIAGWNLLNGTLFIDTKDKALLLPVVAVLVYVIGIIVNQIADTLLQKLTKPLKLTQIVISEESFKKELGIRYHKALQNIVKESQSAYEYLSYRRSVIRIIRIMLFLTLVSPIVTICIAFIRSICGVSTSWHNVLLFVVGNLISVLFLRFRFIKLQVGYYNAIKNFYAKEEAK